MLDEQKQDEQSENVDATQSPSEKLEENRPLGSLTPGAENRESVEIKKEIRPNTE